MNGNESMEAEMYYNYTNTNTNTNTGGSGSGYPPYTNMNESYYGYYDHNNAASTSIQPSLNYVYPPLPVLNQENAYWSMNMHSYRSYYSDVGSTPYYGYEINHPLHRTEINQGTWECSSSMHIEEPSMDMQSEENVVTHSNSSEECLVNNQSLVNSPEVVWQDDIDPDNMTYEELLDLGETVGTQSRGLSQEQIKLLPTARYKAGGFFSRKKSRERCIICLMTYKIGDQQITLPCKHLYHSKCGKKWLSINKTCPVCNSEVFADEPTN